MGKNLINKLNEDFISLLKNPEVTKNYRSYYSSIVNWVNNKKKYFSKEVFENNRLDILVNLDPEEYVVDDPGFELKMEVIRFENSLPDNINILAMIIGDKLWNMVTSYSGKNCPVCDDGLRYIMAELNYGKKLVLECDSCGWCEYLDGSKWNEGVAEGIPANKKDLERYGIKL